MKSSIKVTQIQMNLTDNNGMKAICNIVLNGLFAVNGVRVVEDKNRILIAMPSKKMPDGKFKDICNPTTPFARKVIEHAILNEYQRLVALNKEHLYV